MLAVNQKRDTPVKLEVFGELVTVLLTDHSYNSLRSCKCWL